jgi:hypothetical protein
MEIKEIGAISLPHRPSSLKGKDTIQFSEIMESALQNRDAVSSKEELLNRSDRLVELLEKYSNGLGDPQKTLKQLVNLVETFQEEANLLEADAQITLHEEEGLRMVIQDLALIANVAALRFQRGDFIPETP